MFLLLFIFDLDSSTSRIPYMMMMILLCSCIRYRSIRRYIMLKFQSYSILPCHLRTGRDLLLVYMIFCRQMSSNGEGWYSIAALVNINSPSPWSVQFIFGLHYIYCSKSKSIHRPRIGRTIASAVPFLTFILTMLLLLLRPTSVDSVSIDRLIQVCVDIW